MADTLKSATLIAPDISCAHCVATIEEEVGALAGVRSVTADLATKHVVVGYDEAVVPLERIEATMADAGYPVGHEGQPQ